LRATIVAALALIAIGSAYIRFRWHRSPHAYRAMIGLAVCYFVAGLLIGGCVVYLATHHQQATMAATPSSPLAGLSVSPSPVAALPVPTLYYNPAHAVLPDVKLTPGDTFPAVTVQDVCTPGWSSDHRHVTEAMRDEVYAEYGRTRGPNCCEVDHLIPLELGGSNNIQNLWPEPDDPRPAAAEKDQLENELHRLVCSGAITLAGAQRCIASNWVACWEKYVAPGYGTSGEANSR
jgi:hypothetical protein